MGCRPRARGLGAHSDVASHSSFLVSVLYSKAKLASACGGIIYFLSYVPYMYVAIREEVAHDKITAFEKCIAVRLVAGRGQDRGSVCRPRMTPILLQSLMSTTAFGLGSKYFALYEVAGVGIQWHTFSQSPVEGDDFNLLLAVSMLMVDTVVYGVLTWYIEAVHPGTGPSMEGPGGTRSPGFCLPLGGIWPLWWIAVTSRPLLLPHRQLSPPGPPGMYGLPRPWYFPLQKSYWLGSGRTEAWEWSWPWAHAPRLSVMEEDQACAMESRHFGEAGVRMLTGVGAGFGVRGGLGAAPILLTQLWNRGDPRNGGGAYPPAPGCLCGQAHQGL